VLDVVIVTFNCQHVLDACLHSLMAAPPRREHRILVVDNASTDGTVAHLRERWTGVEVLALPDNRGFAAANNAAIRSSSGELVLLLNPDTLIPPGAVDRLCDALAAHPTAAVAGPRLVDGDGRAELSFGAMLSPFAELRQKVLVVGNDRGVGPIVRRVERMTRQSAAPDWVSGACLLIRRDALERAGLLDERFFMYTEDVDLCAAVRVQGGTILFVPDVQITHLRGRSASTAPRATRLAYRRSQVAFYEKHHPAIAPLLKLYLRARGEWPVRALPRGAPAVE
jgi:GT2 family glycosyltransferase